MLMCVEELLSIHLNEMYLTVQKLSPYQQMLLTQLFLKLQILSKSHMYLQNGLSFLQTIRIYSECFLSNIVGVY
jgi:hypothetical protein